jgi:hypothetical protein
MQGRHAHGAWLAGGGHDRIGEENFLDRFAAHADRIHLGMGRDVGRRYHRVMSTGDDTVADGNRTAKGALPLGDPCAASLDGHLHQFSGIDHEVSSNKVLQEKCRLCPNT